MPPRKKSTPKTPAKQAASSSRQALMKARRLVDQGWDATTRERANALARQALEVCPHCGEAYHLLSELASSAEDARPFLEKAVECATREIGEDGFRNLAGNFWGIHETRPYMSARLNLAECLMGIGRIDEAILHFREMLKLNPPDNQGIRYRLAPALLQINQLEKLDALLMQYSDDHSAEWAYSRALLAFKREGDSKSAREQLHQAQRINEFVPKYLAQSKPLPQELPRFYSPGEESEAIHYTVGSLPTWRATPGAISWVRETLHVPLTSTPRKKRPPAWKQVQSVLQQLPLHEETEWEIDLFSSSLQPAGENRSWGFTIVNAVTGVPLIFETWNERPSDNDIWQIVIETMRNPDDSDPYRPRSIHLTRKAWAKTWTAKLEQIEILCVLADHLPRIADLREGFERSTSSFGRPPEEQRPTSNADFEQIPQGDNELWQIALRKMPTWIQQDGDMIRPTVCLTSFAHGNPDFCRKHLPHGGLRSIYPKHTVFASAGMTRETPYLRRFVRN
ncbi:MAG: hypothetical protein WD065_05785 [Planctomycetaceae bacterium]